MSTDAALAPDALLGALLDAMDKAGIGCTVVVNAAVSSSCRNSTEMRRGECVQDEWSVLSSALNAPTGIEPSNPSDGRVQPVVDPRVVAGIVEAAAVEEVVEAVPGVVFFVLLPHAAVPTANTTNRAADTPRAMTIMLRFCARTLR